MSVYEMAAAIAYELGADGVWSAKVDGDEITFTNEDGEHFLIVVTKLDTE